MIYMTKEELSKFENELIQHGYKKTSVGKATDRDDYEYYKAFYDGEELKYQIFFEIWNFEKYQTSAGYSVSVTIIPDSIRNYVGRRDLKLSTDYCTKPNIVEKVASDFYDMIIKTDKYAKEEG